MLEEMGQMIMTGLSGHTLTEEEAAFLEKENIGAVLLFERNYKDPLQLAQLTNSIQKLRKDYSLFIAVDHEGGRVIRFKKDFTQFPPMLDIAHIDSPKLCFQVAKTMGEELHAFGINANMAPCCDVLTEEKNCVIGDRAFGEDGETVARFISSIIRGLQMGGVVACAKHFPGHGSTLDDSHFTLPVVKTPLFELKQQEFIPFVKAIKSRVGFVMMGHLLVESIDPKLPCTLSKNAHDLLRVEFKYSHIILSDDMQMEAISKNFSVAQAAIMAVNAGSDMLIYRDASQAALGLEAIKKGVKDGKIKNQLIKAALERIYNCKRIHLRNYNPVHLQGLEKKLGTESSRSLLASIEKKISIGKI